MLSERGEIVSLPSSCNSPYSSLRFIVKLRETIHVEEDPTNTCRNYPNNQFDSYRWIPNCIPAQQKYLPRGKLLLTASKSIVPWWENEVGSVMIKIWMTGSVTTSTWWPGWQSRYPASSQSGPLTSSMKSLPNHLFCQVGTNLHNRVSLNSPINKWWKGLSFATWWIWIGPCCHEKCPLQSWSPILFCYSM